MKQFSVLHDWKPQAASVELPEAVAMPELKYCGPRTLLNLACGTRTAPGWNNVDFSPYARLRKWPLLAVALKGCGLLSTARYDRLQKIDPNIVCWDLAKGIPYASNQFDAVYHSHFLEHLTREQARKFLVECWRVLKPDGILRIVVPDLEILMGIYQDSLSALDDPAEDDFTAMRQSQHEAAIENLFDQMVRSESTGTAEQKPWVRRIERLFRGDAAKTGELHRWMYDCHSLTYLLAEIGFYKMKQCTASTSWIEGWKEFRLDTTLSGCAYKPKSLYLEARK